MRKVRPGSRSNPDRPCTFIEPLESRQLLSAAAIIQPADQAATAISLTETTSTAVLGQQVTFAAKVTSEAGVPSGLVRFVVDGVVAAKIPLNAKGKALWNEYALFKGDHTIVAKYTANTDFAGSASNGESLAITRGTLTISQDDGLKITQPQTGTGTGATDGEEIVVDYTGYLTNGSKFDSSLNTHRAPFSFALGEQQVITGWDEGLVGAQVGETRVLIIPPSLGYGSQSQSSIPANSKLIFVIRTVGIQSTSQSSVLIGGANSAPVTSNEAPSFAAGTNFGRVPTGVASNVLTVTVSDTTALNQFPTIGTSGANASDFVLSQPTQDTNNGSVIFTITFTPSQTGLRTAQVDIMVNDGASPVFVLNVEGTGV